jgi:glutaryl-CoA dehydrogenase
MSVGQDPGVRRNRPAVRDIEEFLDIPGLLSPEERDIQLAVRAFLGSELREQIDSWWEAGTFSRDVAPQLGSLGLLGMHLDGYGCAGAGAVSYGLACLELEAVDSGLRSFVSVQGSLAMFPIWRYGSEEQKQQWLPGMAAGRVVGCFGLTESDQGSDPSSMRTVARRDGPDWVLNGSKMWITNGSIADVAVIWARTEAGVRGFLVPTDTPGFTAQPIPRKLSLRASVTAELILDECRLPADAVLDGVTGMRGPLSCLNEARFGITWGVMGAARACLETALTYATTRRQFDRPIAGFQLTQRKLTDVAVELEKGMLLALHLGRLKDDGRLRLHQVSIGKLNNVRQALAIAREVRSILGASGITLDYPVMRHANNLESVLTYEGTNEIHTLIIGEALTGLAAYRG